MEQDVMMIFSNVGDEIKEKLITSTTKCPIHDIHLMSIADREPICTKCQKEVIRKKEKEIQDSIADEHARRKSYYILRRESIFLDNTLKLAAFDNFITNDDETRNNKEKALVIARGYLKGADHNSFFTGLPGTGKSHLAMSILKAVNEHSKPYKKCLFVSIDEIMRRIRDGFNNADSRYTEQFMVDLMTSADLLVIDDLGAETGAITSNKQASDFTTRVLYSVINGRMNKPTVFTTNLNSKELAKMYDQKLLSRMLRGSKGNSISFENTEDKRI